MSAVEVDVPLVRLDELGHPAGVTTELRLRCLGVPDSVRTRLATIGAVIVDNDDEPADALLVSTRLAPDELATLEEQLPTSSRQTIVLAHTGAERLAVHLVSAGADAIVGEGNEDALLGLVDTNRSPTTLLTSYERRFGSTGASSRGVDPSTGLLDRGTFERRIATLGDADEVPRVAFIKVASDRWSTPEVDPIVAVQRRRLSTSLAHLASTTGSELYSTSHGEFGLVGTTLSPHDMQRFGRHALEIVATYRDRGLPLRAVIGHAGSESTTDAEELLELARRAVEVAAADGTHQLLSAEDLSLGVSTTTELEIVVRMLDQIEPLLPEGVGHGERVGHVSAELARLRGWSPGAVARAQLAGHLHDVGRAGMPEAAISGPGELTGELLEVWRTFPARSASMLRLTAGPGVAAAVHSQRERWDGDGFPEGIRSTDIPETARLLAVAHAIDELASEGASASAVATRMRGRGNGELDPELLDLALDNLTALLHARLG
ncbi:MAG TPA: HD domain-containing phosphohydrolase [Egicoccus sp.]|nr:HD domain-containing phosphohydrolase [Egicoccus sp.]HSK21909.1 HD domain-containing phosphohydrolase [Egicoccus sp.]